MGQGYGLSALQFGKECWCSAADTVYDRLGVLDMEDDCMYPCSGDSSDTCGGFDAFEAFEFPDGGTVSTPDGYLGCFEDSRQGRLFSEKKDNNIAGNSATTCKAACSGFAYYGLQYEVECWCGTTDEDYTLYGESIACTRLCPGDMSYTCGGSDAMDIYTTDVAPTPVATLPPTTPPPATLPPTTLPPATLPLTTLPPATLPPTTLPPATLPPTTLPPATSPPIEVPSDVVVDLVPCLISTSAIGENSAGLYMMQLFFQGYWAAKTEELVVSATDDLTALLVDTADTTQTHGKCNAVYVGFEPSTDQSAALSAYSALFKVRIVFFQSSLTHSSPTYQAKLGIATYFAAPLTDPDFIQLNAAGGSKVSIVQSDLQTNPGVLDPPLFSYPVIVDATPAAGVEVLAEYADSTGTAYLSGDGGDQTNAAMLSYAGTDGSEEMHVFFTLGWFDAGSWPWIHYLHEWATKGIFMGERRFYLGAVVDDLFLSTPEFVFDGGLNEGDVFQRCTGEELSNLLDVQNTLNAQYSGSTIITEFAMNGGGIAEQVSMTVDDIAYVPEYAETMVTLKGTKWSEEGQVTVHDINWLATNVPLMQDDMAAGVWEANDDLLVEVIKHLGTPSTFYHQHHTLIHLSRDQLRSSDCITEDTGNVQIALMTGMWDSDNYNWRSMVSPGITGLFNEFCLESAAANLMKCYPGDNTFDGTVSGAAVLTNPDSQFHSIYTTESGNGYDGAQIVPRFATYVYFNCVTGDCLVKENDYIRRFVCECTPLDPDIAEYTCTSTAAECVDADGNTAIQSLGSIESIFNTEAATTTRYLLTGRRDKYMFHQANIKPAGDVGDGTQSLLDYWYERVMQDFSKWITFPVKTIKFDDLCTDFKLHEALDGSSPYATMALDESGAVTGFTYVSGSGAGLVPLTVPTASAASIPTTGLTVIESEEYGTDTTYYLKDDDADTVARVGGKPDVSELAAVPEAVTPSASDAATVTASSAVIQENAEETAKANEENALVGAGEGGEGKLGDTGLVEAEIAVEYMSSGATEAPATTTGV
ncbi:unnamed protein product [Pylaiella littoralis]